ncbi:putative S-adenosyl-L-methionine-dependent methyltransferase Mvan_0910 [Oryza brachyantha]|uniref:putative S-adenosyl-L-methionine-dependent methyltransferase Mvan_0910 n=1 Tax=Oryza brachyantha TaxID=4533 RepID=UPI001ADC1CDD|nr:putative S-adenosyl-L-methionine-dependent methyltransferase Mvan_0910 [Oryza brachyantha]
MSKEEEGKEKVVTMEAATASVAVNGGGGAGGEEESAEIAGVMEAAAAEGVRALHARVEAEWGPVLQSACQTAAARALWARAVRDPAAGVLAGERFLRGLRERMRLDEEAGAREVHGVMIAVRTLWFDARVGAAVAQLGGAAQVVLLGAGMDARAYRLSCLKECTVFELDFPELLVMKSELLHEAMSSANNQKLTMMAKSLIRVPADIRDGDWMTKLQSYGYAPERNTIWVLEGLLYYLHNVHAMQVLETIAACSASVHTVLLADFMNKNAVSLSRAMYHFYHDNPDLLLPSIGFSQVTLSQIGDPQAHFGLLSHPQNLFDKLRRLPRSVETNPEDGTPCCRLYLVEASVFPDDHTTKQGK